MHCASEESGGARPPAHIRRPRVRAPVRVRRSTLATCRQLGGRAPPESGASGSGPPTQEAIMSIQHYDPSNRIIENDHIQNAIREEDEEEDGEKGDEERGANRLLGQAEPKFALHFHERTKLIKINPFEFNFKNEDSKRLNPNHHFAHDHRDIKRRQGPEDELKHQAITGTRTNHEISSIATTTTTTTKIRRKQRKKQYHSCLFFELFSRPPKATIPLLLSLLAIHYIILSSWHLIHHFSCSSPAPSLLRELSSTLCSTPTSESSPPPELNSVITTIENQQHRTPSSLRPYHESTPWPLILLASAAHPDSSSSLGWTQLDVEQRQESRPRALEGQGERARRPNQQAEPNPHPASKGPTSRHHKTRVHKSERKSHHPRSSFPAPISRNHQASSARNQRHATNRRRSHLLLHRQSSNEYELGSTSSSDSAQRPIVTTNKGLVRGITQRTVQGKFVDAFLGIPYAQPPIGQYRFRHPQATQAWAGERDASRMSSSCPQLNDTFFGANFPGTSIWNANTPTHEDCLHLNVWTPFGVANATFSSSAASSPPDHNQQRNNNDKYAQSSGSRAKRPVLVWIFGGGFTSGTASLTLYDGGLMASEEDIIIVSMNYRVAALGFLYLGRPEAPGNAGLFDQLMALQWIADNIEQFGGDPKRVTLFGESAGAVSVSLHLISPLSRNLFQQAILQSAAASAPWALKEPREILMNGLQLASHLGCRGSRGEDLWRVSANRSLTNGELDLVLECMLKAEPNELVKYEVGQAPTILKFPFVPVVDGSFLVESPLESLAKRNFKPARLLLGSNADEGNFWLIYLSELHHCQSQSQSQSQSLMPPLAQPSQTRSNQQQSFQNQESEPDDEQAPFSRRTRRQSSGNNNNGLPIGGGEPIPSPWAGQALDGLDPSVTGFNSQPSPIVGPPQSQSQLQSTPNCRPNDQSIGKDTFHKLIQREEINPLLRHPIARDAIVFEYTNWISPNDSLANSDAIDKIFGDFHFTCPVQDMAIRYSQAGNAVYMYQYKHRSSLSPWPKWMGTLHGDEINFVFGEPLNMAYNYTALEVELSKRMMRYWANFAKFGLVSNHID